MDKKNSQMPLTQSQLSLWIGQRMHPKSPLHNLVYTFTISGEIDTLIFGQAFQRLVNDTDILRTVFTEQNGVPFQSVRSAFTFDLPNIDLTSVSDQTKIEEWIFDRTQLPLQLSEQVFDSALLRRKDNLYIWYLNIHHLATDAVSNVVIYERMEKHYQNIRAGNSVDTHTNPTFEGYVAFEERETNNIDLIDYRLHWQDKVKDKPDALKLYGNPLNKSVTAAERVSISLNDERMALLREAVKDPDVFTLTEEVTVFAIFASLYFIYLSRVGNQKKLSIGTPTHSRTKKDFRETAGLFIEVFPLFLELEEEDTFTTVVQRVQQEILSYLRNVRPGVANAEIGRSFNAILNYIQVDFPDFNGFPTKTKWVHTGHIDSAHAIRCHVYDFNGSGRFEIAFDLNQSVFSKGMAVQVPEHFLRIFDTLLHDKERPIAEPSLIRPQEKVIVLGGDITNPEVAYSISQDFEQQALQRPNAIALQCGGEILTYATLNKRANQWAHFLRNQGVGESSKVALHLHRGSNYIIGVLAVLKTGAAFIPMASDQPSDRVKYMCESSGCSLLISEESLITGLKHATVPIFTIAEVQHKISEEDTSNLEVTLPPDSLAYILYTSGSTGRPKGVMISHKALSNYLHWARRAYHVDEKSIFPLFTSIGFDLSLTATLLPLIFGGRVMVYPEKNQGIDISLLEVIEDNLVNVIKLTPSHLALLNGRDLSSSFIKTMIVGGENFKTGLATSISSTFSKDLRIFNEYGPTEATVGCIVSEFRSGEHTGTSVPIGKPIDNMQAIVLDSFRNPVPKGVVGELYLSGIGLAEGYVDDAKMTTTKFSAHPFIENSRMYRTGDLARINAADDFEYLGRIDDQVKLRGHRIELSDIEANLASHPEIENCAVVLVEDNKRIPESEVVNCVQCGLPSNYPQIEFNELGVCQLCTAFSNYEEKVKRYFKNDDELIQVLTSKRGESPKYDCISLLSGGKDSTYVLGRLIDMGLNVLAFTMDNGYISDQAKENIAHIVTKLGVDHVYGETPHMNEIFVDSLHRYHNVCNGCFKTIYTLSTQIALEKEIPFIVTGLSRGQFFETRLSEELFWADTLDTTKIDDTILEARKLYHRESDAVKRLLDVSAFADDAVFEKVQFVDFYRYSDVSLEELLIYLKNKIGWVRPTDTGRSTNCLINQVGIYVHKKEEGYSNYAFPYSWDVRLGHKTRDESLVEINEAIDETEVRRIMKEIGYERSEIDQQPTNKLVAYFTGNPDASVKELQQFLSDKLPAYMVPTLFKHMDEIPLTKNGKTDKNALENLNSTQLSMDTPYTAPRNEIEELLERIWKEVLQLKKIGVHDDFIALGGHSLAAIRVTARVNEEIEVDFPLNKIFERPTIAEYAIFIEETLTELLKI